MDKIMKNKIDIVFGSNSAEIVSLVQEKYDNHIIISDTDYYSVFLDLTLFMNCDTFVETFRSTFSVIAHLGIPTKSFFIVKENPRFIHSFETEVEILGVMYQDHDIFVYRMKDSIPYVDVILNIFTQCALL